MNKTNCLCSILFWDIFLDLYMSIYGKKKMVREKSGYFFSSQVREIVLFRKTRSLMVVDISGLQ